MITGINCSAVADQTLSSSLLKLLTRWQLTIAKQNTSPRDKNDFKTRPILITIWKYIAISVPATQGILSKYLGIILHLHLFSGSLTQRALNFHKLNNSFANG